MKTFFLLLAPVLIASQTMTAQNSNTFSEAELFQALSWGMPDSSARKLARHMADDPSSTTNIAEFKDIGPTETIYSEDVLLLLSLVSDDARKKVEQRLAEQRLRPALTGDELAEWDARRRELRNRLVAAGKIPAKQ